MGYVPKGMTDVGIDEARKRLHARPTESFDSGGDPEKDLPIERTATSISDIKETGCLVKGIETDSSIDAYPSNNEEELKFD